jgi:site-specific DNA-methyltransferase (adenine-specific)
MILQGNNIELLRTLAENSVDSVTTDPPYGLSFMGKAWDYDVPTVELWKEVLRVLKPGGHLLSFSSARTYHRMVVNVEDAGFEIRDQIMWVYGSGFPKNHNVGKALNKKANYELQTEWDGWGTALKPSHEPIVMARKPINGTVVDNVLEHGTGAINIEDSRVDLNGEKRTTPIHSDDAKDDTTLFGLHPTIQHHREPTTQGRYPANFIHNGLDEDWARYFYCAKANKKERNQGCDELTDKPWQLQGLSASVAEDGVHNREGRGTVRGVSKNNHPTVKPLRLMEYLVKLITPPGGTVLDPFMGSGSTGMAAVGLGFNFIGMELDEEYCNIAKLRIEHSQLTGNRS